MPCNITQRSAAGLPGNATPAEWLERLLVVVDRMTRPPAEPAPAAVSVAEPDDARRRAAAHGRRALGLPV